MWVLVGMAFIAPLAVAGLTGIEMENNVADWLEPDNYQARKFGWFKEQFPRDHVVLMTWEGSSLGDPRVDQLAEKLQGTLDANGTLRGGLKQVKKVRTPWELIEQMEQYDVSYEEAVDQLAGVLISPGKLRIRLTDEARHRSQAAKARLLQWAQEEQGFNLTILEPLKDQFAYEDETESGEALEEMLAAEHDFRVDWPGLKRGSPQTESIRTKLFELTFNDGAAAEHSTKIVGETFFYPGAPVALAVFLTEAGIADKGETLRAIRAAALSVDIKPELMHMAGSPVASSALNQAVEKTAWNTNVPLWMFHQRSVLLLSGLIGICLTFFLLRSFRLGILVLLVSYFTPMATIALIPITGGSMNMVLVVMPSLLLVLTISASIHFANYWRHAATRDLSTAVAEAMRVAREPCLMASLTTAVGLLSLTTSHLTPVRDFGLYSAVGMLVSLGMVLYGLPALLHYFPAQKPQPEELRHEYWQSLAGWIADHSTAVTTVFLIASAAGISGLMHFRTETKVIKYFQETTRVYRDYVYLEDNLSGIVPVHVVVKFRQDDENSTFFADRADLIRELQKRLQKMPDVSGTLSLANFLPVGEPLSKDASVAEKYARNLSSREMENRVKNDNAHKAKTYFTVADADTEFSKAGDEIWRITAQVAILTDLDYKDFMRDVDHACAEILRFEPTADHIVTGMVPLFLETQQEVLDSLIRSFGLAFLLIAAILMVVLKHPVAGLIAMAPNVVPIGTVFGLISWFRIPVDIGTMITASVALGIAVDGTLHLLTWFRNGIREGLTRKESLSRALAHCGPAMTQTSLVTTLGLLVLLPAELLLISRFGWLMASLIAMALLGDIILLPALLGGPLGRIIEKRYEATDPVPAKSTPTSAPEPHLTALRSERIAGETSR